MREEQDAAETKAPPSLLREESKVHREGRATPLTKTAQSPVGTCGEYRRGRGPSGLDDGGTSSADQDGSGKEIPLEAELVRIAGGTGLKGPASGQVGH